MTEEFVEKDVDVVEKGGESIAKFRRLFREAVDAAEQWQNEAL